MGNYAIDHSKHWDLIIKHQRMRYCSVCDAEMGEENLDVMLKFTMQFTSEFTHVYICRTCFTEAKDLLDRNPYPSPKKDN